MLLAHALRYNIALPPEFDSLTNSLMEISRRWKGPHVKPGSRNEGDNLASKFAARLVQARYQGPHGLDIRQAAYSEEQTKESMPPSPPDSAMARGNLRSDDAQNTNPCRHSRPHLDGKLSNSSLANMGAIFNWKGENGESSRIVDQEGSPDSISLAFPPLPLAFQPQFANVALTTMPTTLPQPSSMYYGMNGEGARNEYPDPNTMGYPISGSRGSGGSEDFNSFFEYNFLPTQRISMFSGPYGKEADGDQ